MRKAHFNNKFPPFFNSFNVFFFFFFFSYFILFYIVKQVLYSVLSFKILSKRTIYHIIIELKLHKLKNAKKILNNLLK